MNGQSMAQGSLLCRCVVDEAQHVPACVKRIERLDGVAVAREEQQLRHAIRR